MESQQIRARETLGFLENNDINLGFRRLLDCVADTQDMHLYKEAIELTDWKEGNAEDHLSLVQKAKGLLLKTEKVTLAQHNASKAVVSAGDICKQYGSRGFSLGPISLEIKKARYTDW